MEKKYFSFSGADLLLIFNGKVYGEMTTYRVNSIDKTIEMDIQVFNLMQNIESELRSVNNGRVIEIFANEYGHKMLKTYAGVKYLGYKSNHSIDDKIVTSTLIFNYESDTPFTNTEKSLTTLIEEEKSNAQKQIQRRS